MFVPSSNIFIGTNIVMKGTGSSCDAVLSFLEHLSQQRIVFSVVIGKLFLGIITNFNILFLNTKAVVGYSNIQIMSIYS